MVAAFFRRFRYALTLLFWPKGLTVMHIPYWTGSALVIVAASGHIQQESASRLYPLRDAVLMDPETIVSRLMSVAWGVDAMACGPSRFDVPTFREWLRALPHRL